MKFASLNIGARLGLGFSVLLALVGLITAMGMGQLPAVGQSTQHMMQEPL